MSRANNSELEQALEASMQTLKTDEARRGTLHANYASTALNTSMASTTTVTTAATGYTSLPIGSSQPLPMSRPFTQQPNTTMTSAGTVITNKVAASTASDSPIVALSSETETSQIQQLDTDIEKYKKELEELKDLLKWHIQNQNDLFVERKRDEANLSYAEQVMKIYDPQAAELEVQNCKKKWERAQAYYLEARRSGCGEDFIQEKKEQCEAAESAYDAQKDIVKYKKEKYGEEKIKYEADKSKYVASNQKYLACCKRVEKVGYDINTKNNDLVKLMTKRKTLEAELIRKRALGKEAKIKDELQKYKLRVDPLMLTHATVISNHVVAWPKIKEALDSISNRVKTLVTEDYKKLIWARDFLKGSDLPTNLPGGVSRANLNQAYLQMRNELEVNVNKLIADTAVLITQSRQHKVLCDTPLNELDAIRKEILQKEYALHADAEAILQQINEASNNRYGKNNNFINPDAFNNEVEESLQPVRAMLNEQDLKAVSEVNLILAPSDKSILNEAQKYLHDKYEEYKNEKRIEEARIEAQKLKESKKQEERMRADRLKREQEERERQREKQVEYQSYLENLRFQ